LCAQDRAKTAEYFIHQQDTTQQTEDVFVTY